MRRAIVFLTLVAFATTLAVTRGNGAAGGRPTINAIGMINYSVAKPDFKPGDWVRYHVTSKNSVGDTDAYYVTASSRARSASGARTASGWRPG